MLGSLAKWHVVITKSEESAIKHPASVYSLLFRADLAREMANSIHSGMDAWLLSSAGIQALNGPVSEFRLGQTCLGCQSKPKAD